MGAANPPCSLSELTVAPICTSPAEPQRTKWVPRSTSTLEQRLVLEIVAVRQQDDPSALRLSS